MNIFENLFRGRSQNQISMILLVIGILLLTFSLIVGISDNLSGLLFLYLGTMMAILAYVHRWREKRKFKRFTIGSIIAIFSFTLLHNIFELISNYFSSDHTLSLILSGLGIIFFFLALIFCPPAIIIGGWGWNSFESFRKTFNGNFNNRRES